MATKKAVTLKRVSSAAIEATREIVFVQSNVEAGRCRVCGHGFGNNRSYPSFERQVNHYLGHPQCTLLHVGESTNYDTDHEGGDSDTVAVISIPQTMHPTKYSTGR
jgi:hypothetical protein